jgi:hypothetical protein
MSIDEMTLREEIAKAIEAISLGKENDQLNALGMRILAAKIARGENNYMTNMFISKADFE